MTISETACIKWQEITIKDGVQIFAKIENLNTQVLIISNGNMVLQRTVPYGIKDLFSVLIESEALPTVENPNLAMEYFAIMM